MATQLQITDETPIAMLTVGQQRELFKEWFKELSGDNKSLQLRVFRVLSAMFTV